MSIILESRTDNGISMPTQLCHTRIDSWIIDADHRIAAPASYCIIRNGYAVQHSAFPGHPDTINPLLVINIPQFNLTNSIAGD